MTGIASNREEEVQELRRAMGTLPSESPSLRTELRNLEGIDVSVRSGPENPYLAIFESACATWGDDDYEPKWNKVLPGNRFKVCLAALTGNTLPQAIEVVSFLFHVRGTPRWLFEQHAREMNQFTTYLSVGCRDNNKLDASMILSQDGDKSYFDLAKKNYESIIEEGQESWQSARAVLPLAYHHPYLFYTSYLCLMMTFRKVQRDDPESAFFLLLDKFVLAVGEKYPLLETTIREKNIDEDFWESIDPKDYTLFEKGD